MSKPFPELGLNEEICNHLVSFGYAEPSPIQEAIIPLLLDGRDVIGQAQTGTGKTAAFALPIIQNLQPGNKIPHALVLAPTRELAQQVAQNFEKYDKSNNFKIITVYGGQSYGLQKKNLRKGVDIVVGTPGRIIDLMEQGALDFSKLDYLILDEADEMTSMGFADDLDTILAQTPDSKITGLLSATMPPDIQRLIDTYMKDPEVVRIKKKQLTVDHIDQRAYLVNHHDKIAVMTRLFETETISSAIIFTNTRAATSELANNLVNRGFPAEALSGDLTQESREKVLKRFREGNLQVLVATDVAARGLDIQGISHVFNYDIPFDPEVFVHRVGRTGRAGADGTALTLFTPKEQYLLHRIERYTKHTLPLATVPTEDQIYTHRKERLRTNIEVWLRRQRFGQEKELISQLLEEGHELENIAAAALKMARGDDKKRPIEPVSEVRMKRFSRDNKRGGGGRGDRRGGNRGGNRRGGRRDDRRGDRRNGERKFDRNRGGNNGEGKRSRRDTRG